MATFLILRRVGRKGARPERVEAERLVVGSGPGCGLTLEDPLVAPRHASIGWAGPVCVIRDEGSEAGTYVDDRLLPEREVPLASGARILFGRVQVLATVNAETREVALSTIEMTVSGERVLAATAGARRRPLHRRPLALFALGALGALLPFAVLAATGAVGAFSKGPISTAHLVDTRAGGVAPVRCDACHTPWRGIEAAKCAVCHEAAVGKGSQHPVASPLVAEAGCAACHGEHRGADAKLVPAHVPVETCRACHADAHRDEAVSGVPGAGAGAERGAARVARPVTTVAVLFGGFSHAEHVVGRVADCRQCHKLEAGAAGTGTGTSAGTGTGTAGHAASAASGSRRRDFAAIGYEACTGCHEHEKRRVAAHGTNAQCTACHAGPRERALAVTVASIERAPRAALPAQPHPLAAAECAACHMDAKEALADRARTRPFDHFAHLSTLRPARPTDAPDVVAQCIECHAGIRGAADVASAKAAPPPQDCARCHTGGAVSAGDAPLATTIAAVAFSHAAHTGPGRLGAPGAPLPGGTRRLSKGAKALRDGSCLACHAFAKDAPGERPALGAAPGDCAACHTKRHEDAGLEQCAFCHKGPDDLFEPAPLTRPDYGPIRFDHASTTHAKEACATCHGDVPQATSLAGLRFPRFSSPECRSCHAARQGGDLDCNGCHKMHAR